MSIYRPMKCLRCGHEWVARIMRVRLCPKCKSHLWDQPKETASPRIRSKSDLERLRDIFLEFRIPFQSAEFISVEFQSGHERSKPHEIMQKCRHQLKVAGVDFLFDAKGIYLGMNAGTHVIPRN